MHELSAKSIRLRILLLTILTIIPVIFLIIYFNIVQLNRTQELEKEQLKNASLIAAKEHLQIIEGARQLLISLSTSPEIINQSENCSSYLREVLNKYQRYNNIALANLDGIVICNGAALPFQEQVNISERYFFKNVVKNKKFTVGEYSVSKTTNQPVLSFGYPVQSNEDVLFGIIYSSLDLEWLKNLVSNLDLGENTILLILDKNGKILASNKTQFQVGSLFPSNDLISKLISKSGIVEENINSDDYFYAYSQIGESLSSPFAVVGTSKSAVNQKPNENFQRAILLSFVIAVFSILGAWYIGNSLITKLVIAMEKVEQLRQDFMSLVSHQLRTPLTSIKYFNEILLSESPGRLNKKQKEFLSDIYTSSNRLIALVGTLLDISRLESGKVKLNLEMTSILNLIKEAQEEISPSFGAKRLSVKLATKRGVPENILILCPLCHRKFHHAIYEPQVELIERFLSIKKELLKGRGIEVSSETLSKYYSEDL